MFVFVAKYIKSAMNFLTCGIGEKLVQGRVNSKEVHRFGVGVWGEMQIR